jgi:Ca-activated chloride channel family protein
LSSLAHFADPAWLLLLPLLALPAWLHHRRGGLGALTASRLPLRAGRPWRLHLPFYIRLAALAALVAALARPQLGYAWEESTTEGIDIQIALDVSGSMAAEDFAPNRLEAAKKIVRSFVAQRPGDRIGLTTFAGSALTRAPLTTDRRMLDELVAALAPTLTPDGTAIGVALASAAGRLQASTAKSKVIVLVTDGVNNAGEIDPLSAAAVAQGLGIKVYTVGVGSQGEARVPVTVRDPITGRERTEHALMQVEVDEELLRKIAERTHAKTYRATDARALAQIFGEIDRLERTPMAVKRYVRYRESFQPFAWTALALLALTPLLAASGLTVEP